MKLSVYHATTYRYDEPVSRSTQYIRLTPVTNHRQRGLPAQLRPQLQVPMPMQARVSMPMPMPVPMPIPMPMPMQAPVSMGRAGSLRSFPAHGPEWSR